MTPEEFERVRAHGRDRADAAAPHVAAPLARSRGDLLDLRRLCRSRCAGGEPIEQPWKSRKTVREARRPLRHLGLDGRVRAGAPLLPPRDRRNRSRGRGVRVRHAPDAAHAGSRDARSEAALARANEIAVDWGSGTRIGASLAGFNTIYGRRALARRRRRHRLRRLERDDPDLVGARWRSSRAPPSRSSGSTR